MSVKNPFVWKGSGRHTKVTRNNRPAMIAVVVICVLAAALLVGAYRSSAPQNAKQAKAVSEVKQATAPGNTKRATTRTATIAPVEKSKAEPVAATSSSVTITGCLVRNDETFRLKDTEGIDAPKSRSWKTAFLKRGSTAIEVVDAANRLKMDDYVGQRVSLKGTLVDREMRAHSLERIDSSCSNRKTAKATAL